MTRTRGLMFTLLRSRGRRRRRAIAGVALTAALAAAAIAAVAPGSAAAGTYAVSTCRGFDGSPGSAQGWAPDVRDDPRTPWTFAEALTACASAGEMSVALRGFGPWSVGEGAALVFSVPAPLRIAGLTGLDRETHGLGRGAGAAEQIWWVAEASGRWLDACAPSIPAVDCAATGFNAPPGELRGGWDLGGLPVTALRLSIACHGSAGNASCARPPASDDPRATVRRVLVRVDDPSPPAVGEVSGALAADAVVRGTAAVTVSAADAGAGVAGFTAVVDDVPVAGAAAGGGMCADADPSDGDPREYLVAQPCPGALTRSLAIDTAALAEGEHRLLVRVEDAAGNATIALDRRFTVDNVRSVAGPADGGGDAPRGGARAPARHRPNGRGATERARLTAWLEWRGDRTRLVRAPAGVRVRIRGTLTGRRGRGIAGAAISMVESRPGGAPAATGVRTRPNGRFTTFTRLGPSRDLWFEYRAFPDSPPRSSPVLRLRVRR